MLKYFALGVLFIGFVLGCNHSQKLSEIKADIITNTDDYGYIKTCLINKIDSVNSLRFLPHGKIGISFQNKKDGLGDYVYFDLEDSNMLDKKEFELIKAILLRNNIVHIKVLDDYIVYSYSYTGSPCFKLLQVHGGSQRHFEDYISVNNEIYLQIIPCFN